MRHLEQALLLTAQNPQDELRTQLEGRWLMLRQHKYRLLECEVPNCSGLVARKSSHSTWIAVTHAFRLCVFDFALTVFLQLRATAARVDRTRRLREIRSGLRRNLRTR